MPMDTLTAATHFMRTAVIAAKKNDHTVDAPKPKPKRKPRAKVTGQALKKEQVNG